MTGLSCKSVLILGLIAVAPPETDHLSGHLAKLDVDAAIYEAQLHKLLCRTSVTQAFAVLSFVLCGSGKSCPIICSSGLGRGWQPLKQLFKRKGYTVECL